MSTSIQYRTPEPPTPTEPATHASRLRTVTGNRFPRKCACGCGFAIPCDPEVRYVVDFGTAKPYPTYLSERSPDYGTYRGSPRSAEPTSEAPAFRPATELIREPAPTAQDLDPRARPRGCGRQRDPRGGPHVGVGLASVQRRELRERAGRVRGLRAGW